MLSCKFCKKVCKNENSHRNHERLCKLNPNKQTIKIEEARLKANKKHNCQHCDKLVAFSNLKKHERTCKNNPKVIEERGKICPVCENIFVSESVTCSYSCSNVYFSHLRNKPENYVNYRTICFKHHKKECVVCGENKIVSVHHMNENHKDDSPENLIPLCPTHHQYVHSRYKNEVLPKIEKYLKDKLLGLV
jgi:hypothetical protein